MNDTENNLPKEDVTELPKKNTRKKTVLGELFDAFEAVVIAMVIAFLTLTIVFRTGYVDGDSMVSTLSNNDRYIISGLFYTPKQGDIIVFQPEKEYESNNNLWVKRVIAVGGQEVNIIDGYVYVDGEKIDEPYLNENNAGKTYPRNNSLTYPCEVPEGYVFLMGDNRYISKDSRSIGCVDSRRILGKLILRYYPFNAIGTVD